MSGTNGSLTRSNEISQTWWWRGGFYGPALPGRPLPLSAQEPVQPAIDPSSVESFIFRLLPPRWRDHDLSKRLATAIAEPYDRWRVLLQSLHRYIDPETAPSEWLDWLMEIVALPRMVDLSEEAKRALIAIAIQIWTTKGPAASIELYVQAVAGITANVVALTPEEFIAGVSMAGDVIGTVVAYFSFVIEVPIGSIDEADLRSLLVPVVPVFCRYTVTYV